jgi:hypothetical protein
VTWQFATSGIPHVAHYHASPKGDVWNASHVRNGVSVAPSWPAPHSLSSSSPKIFSTTTFFPRLSHISLPCSHSFFLLPALSGPFSHIFPPPNQLVQLPSPVDFHSSHCRIISPTRPAIPLAQLSRVSLAPANTHPRLSPLASSSFSVSGMHIYIQNIYIRLLYIYIIVI